MIGMLAWITYTVQQVTVNQAVQSTEIKALQTTISQTALDRYSRSEALSDLALLAQRVSSLEVALGNSEDEVNRLRDRIRELENVRE